MSSIEEKKREIRKLKKRIEQLELEIKQEEALADSPDPLFVSMEALDIAYRLKSKFLPNKANNNSDASGDAFQTLKTDIISILISEEVDFEYSNSYIWDTISKSMFSKEILGVLDKNDILEEVKIKRNM